MNAFWAIVLDTWRQSRQQVVFIIMLIVLALAAIGTIALTTSYEDEEGELEVDVAAPDDHALARLPAGVGVAAGEGGGGDRREEGASVESAHRASSAGGARRSTLSSSSGPNLSSTGSDGSSWTVRPPS